MPKDEIREQILHKICGDKLDEKAYKFAKKARNLAPAIIKRAYDISSAVEGDFSANFTTLIKNTLKTQELSEVNEMLVQMEKFDGIFIATTNLMDGLDKAALRRFDLKLEFKALNEEQRVRLFERECELLHLPCEADTKAQIARLECLTPGDFAAVKRQHKFNSLKNAEDFYERLCEEVRVKDLKRENAKAGFFG